jgi:hypothetical protein
MIKTEINKKLNLLKSELKKKIFIGASKSYQQEIEKFFLGHPTGIGVTLQYFKQVSVSGNRTQDIIATFNRGYPAILQLGPNGSASGYTYPYDTDEGTMVYFDDNPNLKEWAQENYFGFDENSDGLKVGKSSTTFFGESKNQWVTKAGIGLKNNSREVILEELRNIKLN